MFATPLPHQHQTRIHIIRHYVSIVQDAYVLCVLRQEREVDWQRENAIELRRLEECRLAMLAAGYAVVETPFI